MAPSVDLRTMLGSARWQGYRSTCLAFATSAAHEVALQQSDGPLDTCEEYLYWSGKQHDSPGPGTTFEAVRDGLASHGHPLEEAWPYDPDRDDQSTSYSPPADAHTSQPRWAPGFHAIAATEFAVRAELDATRVVVLGIPTWPDLDLPDNGKLSVPSAQDLDGSYHAVACVGYDDAEAEMLLRNSWGADWGIEGCAWLPFRFLTEHSTDAWVIDAPAATIPSTTNRTTSQRYG